MVNIKLARQLLGLNQTQLAALLGWTSKRNVVSLERGEKQVMPQTSLAIECLLRRGNKFIEFENIKEIITLLDVQKADLEESGSALNESDMKLIIFSESDVVENYLRENDIDESDVNLEFLRDLQYGMLNELM